MLRRIAKQFLERMSQDIRFFNVIKEFKGIYVAKNEGSVSAF